MTKADSVHSTPQTDAPVDFAALVLEKATRAMNRYGPRYGPPCSAAFSNAATSTGQYNDPTRVVASIARCSRALFTKWRFQTTRNVRVHAARILTGLRLPR